MRRSLICSTAALAALSLAASRACADLVYSFETLYNSSDVPDPAGTRPDDFHPNGGGATVTQSTIGVTDGSNSMEFTQVAGATFTGAQTEIVPAIINDPNTVAVSFDLTVPATGNFNGTFARIGVSEFGDNSMQMLDGQQVQTTGSSECNIALVPGTYHFTVPLIALDNPVSFATNVPFSSIFGANTDNQLQTVDSFEFYFSKSNDKALNVYIDNVQTIGPTTVGTWNKTTGDSWSTMPDWTGGIPQFALDTANLTSAITGNSTITLDGNRSVATLNFSNAHQYTIAQGSSGTLSLDAGGSNTSTINDSGGTHNISAPVNFNTNTTITVNNPGDAINISGAISGAGGLTVQGSGTVDISGANTYIGGTTVSSGVLVLGSSQAIPASNSVITIGAGAKVQLANGIGGVSSELPTIAPTGSIDLTNNHMLISYTAATQATVNAAVRADLISAYNDGTWTGAGGITSSLAQGVANNHFAVGYADGADKLVKGLSSGQILVQYTLYGDADLDLSVTGNDFTILAGNLGKVVNAWDKGDFDYDGSVTGNDFTKLVGNLGKTASGADITLPASDYAAVDAFAAANGLSVVLPEPMSIGLMVVAGIGALSRRRRSTGAR